MTTQNTMPSLETWVKQLNGTLNVSEVAKTNGAMKESDFVKEYRVYLTIEGKCLMTLTNGKFPPKRAIPNLRLTFNETTNRLISATVLSGGKV